jgi:hypothetical protein
MSAQYIQFEHYLLMREYENRRKEERAIKVRARIEKYRLAYSKSKEQLVLLTNETVGNNCCDAE